MNASCSSDASFDSSHRDGKVESVGVESDLGCCRFEGGCGGVLLEVVGEGGRQRDGGGGGLIVVVMKLGAGLINLGFFFFFSLIFLI
ncbi:hypothetical protein HanRHA438_Chr13g0617751 [Helianthus annuus]|uniref:Transmembrane protein n=1 Tax=Helianthus annuus TaxID=4232 RepID=A0A9K3EL55_HELAN|nr:hypothetical protein HanXRQr2_Chr13g0607541 [Helianthus annuus]KAJ0850866.1 hypothetical protein HanPSC8_Chr13g0585821 [Helianthus annuus]KAJ0859888.1 hypothetical protein HanRHA438_Chr13g0617751 [Helianthus annuus]